MNFGDYKERKRESEIESSDSICSKSQTENYYIVAVEMFCDAVWPCSKEDREERKKKKKQQQQQNKQNKIKWHGSDLEEIQKLELQIKIWLGK